MNRLPLVVALLTFTAGTAAATLSSPLVEADEAPLDLLAGVAPATAAARSGQASEGDAPATPPGLALPAAALGVPLSLASLGVDALERPVSLAIHRFLLLPDGSLLADLTGGVRFDAAAFAATWRVEAPSSPAADAPPSAAWSAAAPEAAARAPVDPLAPSAPRADQDPAPRAQGATLPTPPERDPAVALAVAGGLATGALGLLGLALYHRIRPAATLENDTRKAIFKAVCDSPGLGVHDIAGAAGVSYSTATYHLERLVGAGMIVMTPDGNKLCYYKNGGAFTEGERKLIPILKNPEATRLLEAILQQPGTYRAALAQQLGVTATTINWHLRRLRDAGLVEERREGRSAFLHARAEQVAATLRSLAGKLGAEEAPAAARLLDAAPPTAAPAPAHGTGASPTSGS